MALDPAGMQEAILRNLPAKTGRDLDDWLRDLASSGATERRSRIAWLKAHGVGHVTAQVIAERVESGVAPYRASTDAFLVGLFGDRDGDLHQRYLRVRGALLQAVPDSVVTQCKGYVGFSKGRQFAVVRSKGGRIEVGLRRAPDGVETHPVRGLGGGAITSSFFTDGELTSAQLDCVVAAAGRDA